MDYSLFYFADNNSDAPSDRYRLLLDGARFADEHGFRAVWTPERHFHPFGGIYPNPSVTGAAVAAVTRNVQIRAGSVVAPLHHPLRIAEEWSVVDNLSGGRAGISLASGWHSVDFVLNPTEYADRKAVLFERAEQLRQLWRGEQLTLVDGAGNPVSVRAFPPPIQPELPLWITSGGDVETFRSAGRIGAGLLTHLLSQQPEQLADKITEYRAAVAESDPTGWPGHVVVMMHTFLGEDDGAVRETVREPLTEYLRSALGLTLASQDPGAEPADEDEFSAEDMEFLLRGAFERYFATSGLLGSVGKGKKLVAELAQMGVDEVACLIDFGLPVDQVLDGLSYLDLLRRSE